MGHSLIHKTKNDVEAHDKQAYIMKYLKIFDQANMSKLNKQNLNFKDLLE